MRTAIINQLSKINLRLVDITTKEAGVAYLLATPQLANEDDSLAVQLGLIVSGLVLKNKLHPREIIFKDNSVYITTHDAVDTLQNVTEFIEIVPVTFAALKYNEERMQLARDITYRLVRSMFRIRYYQWENDTCA